jgi:hypothetical protein
MYRLSQPLYSLLIHNDVPTTLENILSHTHVCDAPSPIFWNLLPGCQCLSYFSTSRSTVYMCLCAFVCVFRVKNNRQETHSLCAFRLRPRSHNSELGAKFDVKIAGMYVLAYWAHIKVSVSRLLALTHNSFPTLSRSPSWSGMCATLSPCSEIELRVEAWPFILSNLKSRPKIRSVCFWLHAPVSFRRLSSKRGQRYSQQRTFQEQAVIKSCSRDSWHQWHHSSVPLSSNMLVPTNANVHNSHVSCHQQYISFATVNRNTMSQKTCLSLTRL